jgi:hypothetical protein
LEEAAMKTYNKYFSLLIIALAFSFQCFASQNLICSQSDNYYLQQNEVFIAPNGIFVWVDGTLIQVNMLCSDANGIYVPEIELNRQLIRCSNCGRWFTPERINNHDCQGPEWR